MTIENQFSIIAKTCTLKYNNQEGNSIILNHNSKYVIPIFQRPYAWTEEQIGKFISDIFTSFWGNNNNSEEEPLFIGTMQLSAKNEKNEYEIIDGQQRLSTFLIFIKVLKDQFPQCKELETIKFDWLTTNVNNGKQQTYLENLINHNLQFKDENTLNPYLKNAYLISEYIQQQINNHEDEISISFDIEKFSRHLLSNIFFVVIETKAGLSKTLQIFNSINTTGLDLNGGDIFKIRIYEYLKDKKGYDDKIFNEISTLYQKIDENNSKLKQNVTDITGILGIYQYILIAQYNLPVALYNYSTDTFYERLFDTIFNIHQWEHFKNNVSNIDLSLNDIDRIIDIRYKWKHDWLNLENYTAEDVCSVHFIWWSRYSKYWELIFVFLYKFHHSENKNEEIFEFTKQLSKLFFIYSVRFQKLKSDIYYSFMHEVIAQIINSNSSKNVIDLIKAKIGKEEDHNGGWYNLNDFISENLTENTKRKNLICRLSAMLEENYLTTDKEEIKKITSKLFEISNDIEHIQSYHDKDGNKRENIWNEWQNNINSIGNLIILEQNINRSIGNQEYRIKISNNRKLSYHNSEFNIIKNHIILHPDEWDLKKCIERKETEMLKILKYLFNQ